MLKQALRSTYDRRLKLEFHGEKVTSHARLLLCENRAMANWFLYFIIATELCVLLCHANAQTIKPEWNLSELTNAPQWTPLALPASPVAKPVFYAGVPFRGKRTRVFAWLGLPKAKPGQKVPGVVLVHGGAGTAFEEWVRLWVDRGYAAISMDTCGKVPLGNSPDWVRDEQGGPPGWGGFDQIDWPPEDQWTYQAVANVIRANSLLRSLPEVDPDRIGITGISWGGYLTCIVAGVDARFKFAAPVYGCGFYMKTAFGSDLNKLSPAGSDRWMRWWDPSVYLGKAKMPFLWVDGSNDHFYSLNALQLSYCLPQSPRTLCLRLRMPHAQGPGETPEEIRVFADSILKQGMPLPHILASGRDGRSVWADYESKVHVAKAELNYTEDASPWEERKWKTLPIQAGPNKAVAKLPMGTRVYYLNIFDERGCMVSTDFFECSNL